MALTKQFHVVLLFSIISTSLFLCAPPFLFVYAPVFRQITNITITPRYAECRAKHKGYSRVKHVLFRNSENYVQRGSRFWKSSLGFSPWHCYVRIATMLKFLLVILLSIVGIAILSLQEYYGMVSDKVLTIPGYILLSILFLGIVGFLIPNYARSLSIMT